MFRTNDEKLLTGGSNDSNIVIPDTEQHGFGCYFEKNKNQD